jgi:hypothetical protein
MSTRLMALLSFFKQRDNEGLGAESQQQQLYN